MRAVDDARAADMEAEGKPARAIVDEAYRLVEEYSK
jgi:hypothetical protein